VRFFGVDERSESLAFFARRCRIERLFEVSDQFFTLKSARAARQPNA
jgi:hypothetical protein